MNQHEPSVLTPQVSYPIYSHSASDLFWEEHWKKFVWGLVAIVALIIGAGLWSWRQASVRHSADALYSTATTPEAWREVMAEYPGSVPAGNAQIQLAASLRQAGDLDGAVAQLQEMITAQPHHPLVGVAGLLLGEIRQLQGNDESALQVYRETAANRDAGFAGPLASLAEGRLLSILGKTDDARAVFQSVAAMNPETPAAMVATGEAAALAPAVPPAPAPATP
jgi:predicted negative regulator of RcsB-dependent stress response